MHHAEGTEGQPSAAETLGRTGAQSGKKKRFRKDPETDPESKTDTDANGNKGVPAIRGVTEVKMKKTINQPTNVN